MSGCLNDWRDEAHAMAREKGWYDDCGPALSPTGRNIPEALALIHSEVSEALEEYRHGRMHGFVGHNGKPEGFPIEIADIEIRLLDLCGYLGIDLDAAVRQKMAFNATRPFRHGGRRA